MARKAECEQCGTIFTTMGRKRAKTCSKECHTQASRKGGGIYDKAQRKCVPCLYRLGYGTNRIRAALKLSSVTKHLLAAGLEVNHARSCNTAAALGLNNVNSYGKQPAAVAKREAKARLLSDMRLLRQVIGEMRRELIARPEEVEKRRVAANAVTLARYHRTKPQGLRFKSPKAKTEEERKRRAMAHVRKWRKDNPEKWKAMKRKARKKRSKTFAEKQRKTIGRVLRKKNHRKLARSNELWGCNAHFLKQWIESKFCKGMTWENRSAWHVDHIVPCAAFDLSTLNGQKACFHYTNLRPLWAVDNEAKSDTIVTCQPELPLALQGALRTLNFRKKTSGVRPCDQFL